MSDTPQTDAAEFPVMTWPSRDNPMVVRSELARQLERERDDLLSRLTALEHSMPTELAKLERERDEAWERVQESSILGVNALTRVEDLRQALAAERTLADRLAQWFVDQRANWTCGMIPNPECGCDDCCYLRPLDELITAWKEARSEEHS